MFNTTPLIELNSFDLAVRTILYFTDGLKFLVAIFLIMLFVETVCLLAINSKLKNLTNKTCKCECEKEKENEN